MKITIKTLQQKVFQVDAELSDTVADLKQRIHASQDHPIENQKLIYSGKVLKDDKTVEECNIKEKDFLVLMVSKPKASAAGTSSSAAPSTSTPVAPVPTPAAPAEPTTPAPAPVAAAPQPPNAPILTPATATPIEALAPPPQPQAERAFGDMSSFLTGSQLQSTIQNMIEMGFEREQVMRALRASYNNPDRAVEYLFNGIPAHLEQQAQGAPPPQAQAPAPAAAPAPQAPAPQPAQPVIPPVNPNAPQNLFQLAQQQHRQPAMPAGGGRMGAAPVAGAGGGGAHAPVDLAAIQNDPQIRQLRDMMTQNPDLIQPFIQQLAAANPALAAQLANHPEMLLQILGGEGLGEGLDDDGEGGGPTVINVTPEEDAAIQRLQALGFSRSAAAEAYFACDKNEELAANYLFESGFE